MRAHEARNTPCAAREYPFFGDVCLLGLGVTGLAVTGYFCAHPQYLKTLTVFPGEADPSALAELGELPTHVTVAPQGSLVSGTFDYAVVSPGIAPHSALYRSAGSAAPVVLSEPELAWRISPERWVCVTGTNGKTTVTELTAALLCAAGQQAWVAGNIGRPCIEVVDARQADDWIVAELSSYQLHSTLDFAPAVAILLNITPDHLSWHGSHEAYAAAKLRAFTHLAADAPVLLDVSTPQLQGLADQLEQAGKRVVRINNSRPTRSAKGTMAACSPKSEQALGQTVECAFVDPDTGLLTLASRGQCTTLLAADELLIKGAHNQRNALAAAAAALLSGADATAVAKGLAAFAPLPHRFEPCGTVNGVHFINDSKATNTDAAIKAIGAFDGSGKTEPASVIALFGGQDKGTPLEDLAQACASVCKTAVCYGAAGQRFFEALAPAVPTVRERGFASAFARAVKLAQPGDTVLLAPACASYDEFDSFEARGERFKQLVAALENEQHG